MRKFIVSIEETVVEEFEVIAKNAEQAMDIAKQKYDDCEFVLEPGKLISKQMAIIKPGEEAAEWYEF